MEKLSNYSSVKMQGYAFYNLTCGLDGEIKNNLLENYLLKFSSDDEAKVFINTVLYPFDTNLYLRLISLKSNSYDSIVQELNIDEELIREKFTEYAVNHFENFLLEFDMKIDNSLRKSTKK